MKLEVNFLLPAAADEAEGVLRRRQEVTPVSVEREEKERKQEVPTQLEVLLPSDQVTSESRTSWTGAAPETWTGAAPGPGFLQTSPERLLWTI